MTLSLPLVIGIIIRWIHGMSTENICNPAKNNKTRNQQTVCNLSTHQIDNLLNNTVARFSQLHWWLKKIFFGTTKMEIEAAVLVYQASSRGSPGTGDKWCERPGISHLAYETLQGGSIRKLMAALRNWVLGKRNPCLKLLGHCIYLSKLFIQRNDCCYSPVV